MSNYLDNLVAQALGTAAVLRPRPAARFEHAPDALAFAELEVETMGERSAPREVGTGRASRGAHGLLPPTGAHQPAAQLVRAAQASGQPTPFQTPGEPAEGEDEWSEVGHTSGPQLSYDGTARRDSLPGAEGDAARPDGRATLEWLDEAAGGAVRLGDIATMAGEATAGGLPPADLKEQRPIQARTPLALPVRADFKLESVGEQPEQNSIGDGRRPRQRVALSNAASDGQRVKPSTVSERYGPEIRPVAPPASDAAETDDSPGGQRPTAAVGAPELPTIVRAPATSSRPVVEEKQVEAAPGSQPSTPLLAAASPRHLVHSGASGPTTAERAEVIPASDHRRSGDPTVDGAAAIEQRGPPIATNEFEAVATAQLLTASDSRGGAADQIDPPLAARRRPVALTDELRPAQPAPTILVTIGRIEVRAATGQARTPAVRQPAGPSPLDEYLRQRNGGRR